MHSSSSRHQELKESQQQLAQDFDISIAWGESLLADDFSAGLDDFINSLTG